MFTNRQMKILILGLNYAPEIVGIAVYTTGLAEALAAHGHEVAVIAGKPYYPAWRVRDGFRDGWTQRSVETGVDVTRVAHYVPARPSGLRRILHHASFALSSLLPALKRARELQPDIVLTVAPSLIAAPIARLAAELTGAKSWLHIQDFEVEAAMATGLVRGGVLIASLGSAFEKILLCSFERVSSISSAMCRKLAEKGVEPDRIVEFRNWAKIDASGAETSSYREEWNIMTPHVAIYSGNIANKQGIDLVVAAARQLRHRNDLTFIICGEGPNRARLEASAAGLSNIRFFDLQPKERLSDLLNLATLHLLPQLGSTADLVLPSKLANMLASGRPVVATARLGTGLAKEVEGCGIVTPPEDEAGFVQAIERLLNNEAERAVFAEAAIQRARQIWRQETIIGAFEAELQQLVDYVPKVGAKASTA
jgi:colanic acid biosynthesis glycosyl transferase WcaI